MNRWLKGIVSISLATVLVDAFLLERLLFRIKHYFIGEKLSEKKIRILHLSDIHLRQDVGLVYRKMLGSIKKLSPDLILITGDAIDRSGDPRALEKFLRLLPHVPVAAVLGNHEHESKAGLDAIKSVYEVCDRDLLVNATREYKINDTVISVTGLDDINHGSSDLPGAVKDLDNTNHHFILSHSPGHYDDILKIIDHINKKRTIPLTPYLCLSGHNHGGQVKLGGYAPVLPANHGDYVAGWFGNKKPYLYVSKGFGNSSLQVRFWARSEIAVFDYFV